MTQVSIPRPSPSRPGGADFAGNGANAIVSKGTIPHEPPYYQYHLFIAGSQYAHPDAGMYGFAITVDGVTYGADSRASRDIYTPGQWHHFVGTYDGETISLYRDGILIGANSTPSGPIDAMASTARIAAFSAHPTPDSRSFTPGLIDEVSIYNRALSASEVQALFAAGSEGKATVVVTTTADTVDTADGATSLREAINSSNATPGRDVIGFNIQPSLAGLISQYGAEGDANDSAGSNHGVLENGAKFAAGQVGQAFSLDGVDDYVDLGNDASLNPENIAVEAWWYGVDFDGIGNNAIVSKGNIPHENPYYQYHLGVTGTRYRDTPGVYSLDVSVGGVWYPLSSGADTYIPGEWNHFVGTYDGETLSLYRNGVLVSFDKSPSGALDVLRGNARIGAFSDLPVSGAFLLGLVDEVGIYDRALSAAEVQALFAAGKSPQTIVHTISPNSALPIISDPVIIDGYTQPGAIQNTSVTGFNGTLHVELTGAAAGAASGLDVTAGNSTIRGLVINRFGNTASELEGAGILLRSGGNTIEGNLLGTDVSGTRARPNALNGVTILSSSSNTIGGTIPQARNILSGNGFEGVAIRAVPFFGPSAGGNIVQGNLVGTAANGINPLGNGRVGVAINMGSGATAKGNVVGGTAAGAGNRIAFNGSSGVFVGGEGGGVNNTILSNSIFSNAGLGIDLGPNGPTANDAGDADAGFNNLQNFPVLRQVTATVTQAALEGILSSAANTAFRIELFTSNAADPSGFGEGQLFLGATNVTTDLFGNASFSRIVPGDWRGKFFTATATRTATGDTSEFSRAINATPPQPPSGRRPVLIVPGIGGTYAADLESERDWLLRRGVAPEELAIEPLVGTYDAMITTLEEAGYVQGEDLFVANYDWRLPPAPTDEAIDGHVSGLTAAIEADGTGQISITDDVFEFGVDYLGFWLRQVAESWNDRFDTPLDSVDVITHSTGGLIVRSYMQSDAHGGSLAGPNQPGSAGALSLPTVNNFIMVAVPNRGATLPWNPLHDNWNGDTNLRFILSSLIDRDFEEVVSNNSTIDGPTPIMRESILVDGQPSKTLFVEQYVPSLRSLLATYNFLRTDGPSSPLVNVNSRLNDRNTLLLDLNNGLDFTRTLQQSQNAGDFSANDFADLASVSVIFGENLETPSEVVEHRGPDPNRIELEGPIVSFDSFFAHDPEDDETWFEDVRKPRNGDTTVPIQSSRQQFDGDDRVALFGFRNDDSTGPGNTDGKIGHGDLLANPDVEGQILEILGHPLDGNQIVGGTSFNCLGILTAIGFPQTTVARLNASDFIDFIGLDTSAYNPNSVCDSLVFNLLDGEVTLFDGRFAAAADGTLELDLDGSDDNGDGQKDDGVFGALSLVGSGGVTALDLDAILFDGQFSLLVNATSVQRTIDLENAEDQVLPPYSLRLLVDGSLHVGTVTVDGTFLVAASPHGFTVFGNGQAELGTFVGLFGPAVTSSLEVTLLATLQRDASGGIYGAMAMHRSAGQTIIGQNFFSLGQSVVLAFNATDEVQIVSTETLRPPEAISFPALPPTLEQNLSVDPGAIKLVIDGEFAVGGFEMSGVIQFQANVGATNQLSVFANVTTDLELPGDIINAGFTATVAGTIGVDISGPQSGIFAALLLTRSVAGDLGNSPIFSASSVAEVGVSFNTTPVNRQIAAPAGPLGEKLSGLLQVPRTSIRARAHGDLKLGELAIEGDILFAAELGDTSRVTVATQGDLRFGLFGGLLGSAAATVSLVGSIGVDVNGNDGSGAGLFGMVALERCGASAPLGENGFNSQATVFTGGFNFTPTSRDVELPPTIELACNSAVPGNMSRFLDLPAQTVRVGVGGELVLSGFGLTSFFQIQAGADGLGCVDIHLG